MLDVHFFFSNLPQCPDFVSLRYAITRSFYQRTENRGQITEDKSRKWEFGLRPLGAIGAYAPEGGRKDWETDVRFYFYLINLFNAVN